MRRLLLIAVLLLAACGGSPRPLDSLIVQQFDLPADLDSFSTSLPWRIYPGAPHSDDAYYFEVYRSPDKLDEVGNISVIRYTSDADVEAAWKAIKYEVEIGRPSFDVPDVGERAVNAVPVTDWPNADVLFVRCRTVVHLTMPASVVQVTLYARHLDERMRPVVCGA